MTAREYRQAIANVRYAYARGSLRALLVCAVACLTQAPRALAIENVWTGTGVWDSPGNWSQGLPAAQQDVVIDGSCTVTNPPPELASLKVNSGRTLTFNGWQTAVTATVVTVEGIVTHAINAATATNTAGVWPRDHRVWFAASNVTISGTINADYKGWQGTSANKGYGEGATAFDRGGAGHGGRGSGHSGVWGGPVYGVSDAPEAPGSGGNGAYGSIGGHGGGAVRINASGHVLVNGTISANASSATGTPGNTGGGSGGSIYITCATLGGTTGVIRANGGGGHQAGGGGGRIAVVCNDLAAQAALPRASVMYSVLRGLRNEGSIPENGTFHLNSPLLIPIEMAGVNGRLVGLPAWSMTFDHVTMSNSWIQFPDGLSEIQITVANDMKLNASTLDVFSYQLARSPLWLDVGGNLTLTNTARLYVYAGVTNATRDYGALVHVVGTMHLSSNSWVYPTSNGTNGASPLFTVGKLIVLTNAGFNATGRGYAGKTGLGRGPGASTATGRAGAGHGGKGGNAWQPNQGGPTYGSSNAPVQAGSSGGSDTGTAGGNGGGAIRVESSGRIVLDGTLTADGATGSHDRGAGSGGSIYLIASALHGNGTLVAKGGNTSGTSGGGGGGRIAVWSTSLTFPTANATVAGGIHGTTSNNGVGGTIVWGVIPAKGTLLLVR